MQPTRVKTSFAEDVKLLSNALPLLSVFFPPFLLKLRLMLLQVLDGSHGNEAACPLNAEHLQSCEKMYILNSLLYLQVTGLARIQNVKRC